MNNRHDVAIVTGSARGIGRAIAEKMASQGMSILVHARQDQEAAQRTATELAEFGAHTYSLTADLTENGQAEYLFDQCEQHLGQASIVVANAGVFIGGGLLDTSPEDYDKLFAVNTRSAFQTMQIAGRRLRDEGRIVALSTSLIHVPREGTALYAASKAAVEQFVRGFARELGHRGITVNAVAPASTNTRMATAAAREAAARLSPLGRAAEPDDIADIVAFLVSPQARWLTGQVIGSNGGVSMY